VEVAIAHMPALRVGVVRGRLSYAPDVWGRLGMIVEAVHFLDQPGVGTASILPVEIVHARGTLQPEQVAYAAAVVVPEDVPLPEGLAEDRIPEGRYARATYLGPYAGLADAWSQFIDEWLPMSGCEVADGVCFEVYRNALGEVPEAELRTDLYIPIL
jgi:DNA gyrase inhibitor GyrI